LVIGGLKIYAIIETGGKQYRVSPGQEVDVELLNVTTGVVELDKVLMIADEDKVVVGNPTIEGAKVVASWREDGKGDKVLVFKYKPKSRYRKKTGHRQSYTRLTVDQIVGGGFEAPKPARKTTRRKKKETVEAVETAEAAE
jgi:large subunit ribosomal protein L21